MRKISFIQERTDMGVTRPFICQADDGQWFIVKTKAMMPIQQLLAETIGSELAIKMGLPCPEISFVEVTNETNKYILSDWLPDLSVGSAFTSKYIDSAKIAKTVQAKNVNYFPESLQKQLYMFDRWILNSDRTASQVGTGNINLLFDEQQQKILVIDHNLAFDEENSEFDEHIFAPKNRIWRLDFVDQQLFTDRAIDILKDFDHIYKLIPDDWFPVDEEEFERIDNYLNKIYTLLNRITNKDYWSNIE